MDREVASMNPPLRHGLVGYGNGGRHFHAPYIVAAEGVELAGVVVRDPGRRAQLEADYPGMPAYDSISGLIDAGVDAVTITTPPETRRELVLEAVARGVHVVADKPFAPSAPAARELADAAAAAGVALNVFQNRRWDADFRTLAAVIDRGDVGEVWRVDSRFDLDDPGTLEPGPHGGLLRDLGAHVVDQMIVLLGPVFSVYAQLDWVDSAGGRTDAGFSLALTHLSGARSRVSASKLQRVAEKELRVYGSLGSYEGISTDGQTRAIFAGQRPLTQGAAWGYEPESAWGILRTAAGSVRVPSARGAYQDFYTQFAAAVAGEAPFPVPAAEAIRTIEVLDAARVSALENRVITVPAD
jgi:predicted dehydrogenase